MKILLIVLLIVGSIFTIALLIAALFGIELIEKVLEYFDNSDDYD